MNKDRLAGIIFGALGASALVGISALVWNFGVAPMIKDEKDLKNVTHPDSTIEYSGTIWSSWKEHGEQKGIKWDIWMKGIVDYNQIKDPDYPGTYKVPILD